MVTMTDKWFLSRDAMKGLELVTVCANALFALEQNGSKEKVISKDEIQSSIEKGQLMLKKLRVAAESHIRKGVEIDPMFFRLVEDLLKELRIPPSELSKRVLKAEDELGRAEASEETVALLETLSNIAKNVTGKRIVALSSSIH